MVMICTGIWRAPGSCLRWLSTVQPRMSGKKIPRELAADGQTQAGTAEAAARAGIRLLKRLEDDFLLVGRNADAGVAHGKSDHQRRILEIRMIAAPAALGGGDAQLHLTLRRELEGI